MKPFNGAEFSTIIDIKYGIASLASCVSIENKHVPLLVNNIAISQFNEVCQPNGVQGRAPTEGCGGQPLPLRIFTFKGASVAFV